PYSDTSRGSYVLSCLDCHEPHGSANAYLIRNSVNAGAVSVPDWSPVGWDNLCNRCHDRGHHKTSEFNLNCTDCHIPHVGKQECTYCHYHGSFAGGYKTF
ncbi:MAG: hypothetical protein GQ578_03290, partial [Desulfuromonadaceae bacterium]|nr:hypothetical protein [Desulfuromonadaceae bacterium]